MVGVLEDDDLLRPGVGAREAQGEIVGLGAGADEKADAQRIGKGRTELQGVLGQEVVQVAGVGVELRHLPLTGGDHVRVAVADVADVVDQIEESPALFVVEVLTLAADDLERFGVGDAEVAAHMAVADREDLVDAPRRRLRAAALGLHRTVNLVSVVHGHPLQQAPDRLFGDLQVSVVGVAVPAAGRHQHAGDQPGDDEISEEFAFESGQRADLMVAPDHLCGVGQRILPVEHEIGGGDGEFGDDRSVEHVAEVDEAAEFRCAVDIGLHQYVAVIGIVVDHPVLEFAESWRYDPVKPLEPALDQLPLPGIGDEFGIPRQSRGRREVPLQLPPGARVVESLQREIEAGEVCPDLFDEPWRTVGERDEGDTFEVRHQPDPANMSVVVLHRKKIAPGHRRNRSLDQVRHRAAPQVSQHRDLTFEGLPVGVDG